MALTYKIKGISDDQTECDCCGRRGLKRTVALEIFESGETTLEVIRVGVDCASVLMSRPGRSRSARSIKLEAESVNQQIELAKQESQRSFENKIRVRIASTPVDATKAYISQFKTLDPEKMDWGMFLTDGKQFVRIPGNHFLSNLGTDHPEHLFINHLKSQGFVLKD